MQVIKFAEKNLLFTFTKIQMLFGEKCKYNINSVHIPLINKIRLSGWFTIEINCWTYLLRPFFSQNLNLELDLNFFGMANILQYKIKTRNISQFNLVLYSKSKQ